MTSLILRFKRIIYRPDFKALYGDPYKVTQQTVDWKLSQSLQKCIDLFYQGNISEFVTNRRKFYRLLLVADNFGYNVEMIERRLIEFEKTVRLVTLLMTYATEITQLFHESKYCEILKKKKFFDEGLMEAKEHGIPSSNGYIVYCESLQLKINYLYSLIQCAKAQREQSDI
jgi:hypothetical protein